MFILPACRIIAACMCTLVRVYACVFVCNTYPSLRDVVVMVDGGGVFGTENKCEEWRKENYSVKYFSGRRISV